jgi:kumamolisin
MTFQIRFPIRTAKAPKNILLKWDLFGNFNFSQRRDLMFTRILLKHRTTWAFTAVWVCSSAWVLAGEDRVPFANSVKEIQPNSMVLVPAEYKNVAEKETMQFTVVLKMKNSSDLAARIANGDVVPESEMEEKYYPSATEYDEVKKWFESRGLTVERTTPTHLSMTIKGEVSKIIEALEVKVGKVKSGNKVFTSAVSVPSLPANVAKPVLSINGLQPQLQAVKHSQQFVRTQVAAVAATANVSAPPFKPLTILTAYNGGTLGLTGSGETIAIVIDAFPDMKDVKAFWTECGIAAPGGVENVPVGGGPNPSPEGEETLDVEWTSGIAPGAKIRMYTTGDLAFSSLDQAYQMIIDDLPQNPGLHQVSLSYGLGEQDAPIDEVNSDAQFFQTLLAKGVTVFVSSGDGGSSPSSGGHDHTGKVQVETPASDPSVIAVGGTTLLVNAATGEVSSESAWFDGGGGVSTVFKRPIWQKGTTLPDGQMRLVPDVAAVADPATGALVVLGGRTLQYGGTSWSAPQWAGFCALINEARIKAHKPPLGNLGNKIYALLGTDAFRDIVKGSNGKQKVYDAGLGFDLCTGIGVPNLGKLVDSLTK